MQPPWLCPSQWVVQFVPGGQPAEEVADMIETVSL